MFFNYRINQDKPSYAHSNIKLLGLSYKCYLYLVNSAYSSNTSTSRIYLYITQSISALHLPFSNPFPNIKLNYNNFPLYKI